MAITKEQKKEIVKNLEETFSKSKSVVFVNFHGLNVADASSVRRALKEEGVSYKVAKKTLVNRALETVKLKGEKPLLERELSLAFLPLEAGEKEGGDSLIAPARGVYGFQKKLDNKISIIGGIFDGEYKSKEAMLEIAQIPPLEVLRGMFVNVINSPIQRLAISLNEIAKAKSS